MRLDNKKILIVRLSSLGDVLLSTPLIRTLKKKYRSEVYFVVREEYQDLLKLNPNLKKLYIYSRDENANKALMEELRNQKFDLAIDLQNNLRSRVLISGLKAKVYHFHKSSWKKILLVRLKINRMKNLPQIPVRYASAIPDVHLDKEGLELFTNKQTSLEKDRKYIGITPGSRHFTKRWPDTYFIELAAMLSKEGYTIVLFGGRDDRELCEKISSQLPGSINLSNNNDILQTYADMHQCEAVICNDSGLMHTAGAAGVPLLAIFGSTVKEFGFSPYRTKNLILENKSLSCRPCTHIGRKECPLKHFKCMLDLTPSEAYKMLKALLNSQ